MTTPEHQGVTVGHFTLTSEQRRFKTMLAEYPRLVAYWNFENRECDIEALSSDLGAMSHGERIIGCFLAAVWTGENVLEFDLFEAARILDDAHRERIQQWPAEPWFP